MKKLIITLVFFLCVFFIALLNKNQYDDCIQEYIKDCDSVYQSSIFVCEQNAKSFCDMKLDI